MDSRPRQGERRVNPAVFVRMSARSRQNPNRARGLVSVGQIFNRFKRRCADVNPPFIHTRFNRDMVNKTTNPRAAEEIVAALSTPGRQARLQRWTPEFLDRLGDGPDPEEVRPVRWPRRSGNRSATATATAQRGQQSAVGPVCLSRTMIEVGGLDVKVQLMGSAHPA